MFTTIMVAFVGYYSDMQCRVSCGEWFYLLLKQWSISKFACASVSKRVFMQYLLDRNECDLCESELVGQTHFH